MLYFEYKKITLYEFAGKEYDMNFNSINEMLKFIEAEIERGCLNGN